MRQRRDQNSRSKACQEQKLYPVFTQSPQMRRAGISPNAGEYRELTQEIPVVAET
jgi:hypothetical protein